MPRVKPGEPFAPNCSEGHPTPSRNDATFALSLDRLVAECPWDPEPDEIDTVTAMFDNAPSVYKRRVHEHGIRLHVWSLVHDCPRFWMVLCIPPADLVAEVVGTEARLSDAQVDYWTRTNIWQGSGRLRNLRRRGA